MSLKEKSISGVKWNSFSAAFGSIMALSKTAIMARLLTPSDFGLMAMLEGVMVFGDPLSEMGMSNAIIQAKVITRKQLSTLYWLNIGLGFVVFLLMVLISPLVADFYNEEQLTGLLMLLALTFILGPIGAQFNVLFQKELNFSLPVKIDFIANIISFIITVALAYTGRGVYALIYGKLARTLVSTVLLVFFGLRYHRPQFYFNIREVKKLLSFGAFQIAERYGYTLAGNWDKILIGKFLGAEQLGYYNIAITLVVMPMATITPIISKVIYPVFSQISDNAEKLNRYYSKGIALLMTINVPLYFGVAITAREIVILFFGAQWTPAIPILQIASIMVLILSFGHPGGSIILAKGRADFSFYWSIITSLSIFIFILLAYYIHQSLLSITIGILFHRATVGSLWHIVISKIGGIEYVPILKNLLILVGFGLVMCLTIYGINTIFSFTNLVVKVLVNVTIGAAVYSTLLLLYDPNSKEMINLLRKKA